VGGAGTGTHGTVEGRLGKGAGHVRERLSGLCPWEPIRPGIEGQRMSAIGGNSNVRYICTATWLESPWSVPGIDVGRRASIAIIEMEMWVQGLTWRKTCPQPTPSTHI